MSAPNNDHYAITVGFKNMDEGTQERLVELIGLLDDTQQTTGFEWIAVPEGDLGVEEMCDICKTHKVFKELAKLTTKTTPLGKKFGPGLSASMGDLAPEHVAVLRHVANAYILGNLFEKQVYSKSSTEIDEYGIWAKLAAAGITNPPSDATAAAAAVDAINLAAIKQQFMDVTDMERYNELVDILECFVTKKVKKSTP